MIKNLCFVGPFQEKQLTMAASSDVPVRVSGDCSWLKEEPNLWKKYVVGSYAVTTDCWLWKARRRPLCC